jgi:hypothetical protein
MSLFTRRLKNAWEFAAQEVIWRVHPAVNGRVIGEERDLAKKRTSFFCVEQRTGKVLWKNITVGELWWVGIELVDKDVLLVHGYATPDMPAQRGLTAIDAQSGMILWSNSTWELARSTATGFVVLSPGLDASVETHVDRRTGKTFPAGSDIEPPNQAVLAPGLADAQFPLPFDPANVEKSSALQEAVKRYVNAETSGITEYLTLSHQLVLTTFERSPERFTAGRSANQSTRVHIRVLDAQTGKEQFSEIVASSASGQIPDTFFSQNGTVFYVRERKVLCALRLMS